MSKPKRYKSSFQDLWQWTETFRTSLQKKPDPYKVRCKVCATDIAIELHSIAALFSHAGGTKHKERLAKSTPSSFFKCTEPSSSVLNLLNNDAGNSSEASSSKQTTIRVYTNRQFVRKAEIIWGLDVLMTNTCSVQAQMKVICLTPCFLTVE